MSHDLKKRERLLRLIYGKPIDRPPVAFWNHFFPGAETGRPLGDASRLAYDTAEFYREYDPDLAKVMPDISFMIPDRSIQTTSDWDYVSPLSLSAGNGQQYIHAVQESRKLLGPDAPLVATVFSPLALIQYFIGLQRVAALAEEPNTRVHRALAITARSVQELCHSLLQAGADGIYYSVWGSDLLSPAAYAEFGRPYDLMGLEGCRGAHLNILHVHGAEGLHLDTFKDYPTPIVSWSTLDSGISMESGKQILADKIPMGGLAERGDHLLADEPGAQITQEAENTIRKLFGTCIIAPGCSLPYHVSDAALRTIRQSVGD